MKKNNWNEWEQMKAKSAGGAGSSVPRRPRVRSAAGGQAAPPVVPAPRRSFGMVKRILAAACAFGVVLSGSALWRIQGGQSADEAVAGVVANSFGIVAYAPRTRRDYRAERQQDCV